MTRSAERVSTALAALEANAWNLKRTARELGIPRSTLRLWRDKTATADPEKKKLAALSAAQGHPYDWPALWADAQYQLVMRLTELAGTSTDIRALAIAGGIASDKMLDHAEGRRGVGVSVHQQQLTQFTLNFRDE